MSRKRAAKRTARAFSWATAAHAALFFFFAWGWGHWHPELRPIGGAALPIETGLIHHEAELPRRLPRTVPLPGAPQGIGEKPSAPVPVAPVSEGHADHLDTAGLQSTGAEMDRYSALIRSKIDGAIEYPLSLRRRGIQGEVAVQLVLESSGRLSGSRIVRGSGSAELDRLALKAVTDAEPFPELPPELRKMGHLTLSLPIQFRIQKR
ncbi:MAG: energy transducer TonB family protein [Bdellovibrionota bacterium]